MRRLLPLCILLCLLPCASASASRTQPLTFEAPRDLMNPDTRPAALAELDSLGVRSLRVILQWSSVAPAADQAAKPSFEPTNPAAYDWGEYDPLMAAAKARNWSVLMTISGPVPRWATQARLDNLTRPSTSAFAAFTTAVGRRYGDQVRTWAIWNEPNQPQFLRPQFASGGKPASPTIYRGLYLAGVRGLTKAGQGGDSFLLGETSPRGTPRVVAPLTFLRGVLCLNAKYKRARKCGALTADGYAHHAYTTRQGPSFKPPPNDVTIGVLSRLTTALDRSRRAGALTKQPAGPPDRVRHPVDARHDQRRVAGQAGRVPRDLRAPRLRQPARRRVLAVPAARQRPDRARRVRRLRVRAALRQRHAEAVAERLPPAARRAPDRAQGLDLGARATGERRDDRDRHLRRPGHVGLPRRCAPCARTRAATSSSRRPGAPGGAGTSRGRTGPATRSAPTRADGGRSA